MLLKSQNKTHAQYNYWVRRPFIGDVSAQLIANHYPTLERFLNAKEDDLLTIDQIGPKMVDAIKPFNLQRRLGY